MTPTVQLTNVAKLFGSFAALRDITADFDPGNLYVIIGDNGAGKSTLLRIIAGLTRPTAGSSRIFGDEVFNIRGRIGFMAHDSMLYDEFTARENLNYFAQLYGIIAHDAVNSAIRLVGLDPALDRPVSAYSQGMRQRLSLARALVHRPELLLLDEPFSNLDAASSARMASLVGELRDSGRTILLVTHQPALLRSHADEFITLAAGVIQSRSDRLPGAFA